jgi:hypothetical protein
MSSPIDVKNTSQLVPVPSSLRQRLWYGLMGAGLFNLIAIVESTLRPDYDANQQSVSSLSLGGRGWIQVVSFNLFGVAILCTVTAWRKILAGGRGAKSYPILTLLMGISLILCGIFKQDPAPGYDPGNLALTAPTLTGLTHLLFAAIGALCSVLSLIVMAGRFAHTPLWRGWNIFSILMAFIMTSCVTVYSVWSTKPTGYAGMFERIALLIVPIWGLIFLARLESGVAFMKATTKKVDQR